MKFCNLEYDFKDRVIHRSTIICMLKCTSIYFVTKIKRIWNIHYYFLINESNRIKFRVHIIKMLCE